MNKKTSTLEGLDTIVINHLNYKARDAELRAAQKFLERYPADKVLPYEDAKALLSDPKNDAYTWTVAMRKGKVAALVVSDVWEIPKNKGLHYTPFFYATADEENEPLLKSIEARVISAASEYSLEKGMRNIGMLTDDTNKEENPTGLRTFKALADSFGRGGYLFEGLWVPTLRNLSAKEYKEEIYKPCSKVDLVFTPLDKETLKVPVAKELVLSYLEEAYNKDPDEPGYMPLRKALYFKDFAKELDKRSPDGIVHFEPIR